jgi:hypothetical protein
MKKILLIIAIGVSNLNVNAQYWATYENDGSDKYVGDTLKFYISEPKVFIKSCIGYGVDYTEDITHTFFFDYTDSKGRSHYKQVAYMYPRRKYECRLTLGGLFNSFMANPTYYLPLGIDDNEIILNTSNKTCYSIQGIKIDSPNNYNGAIICEGNIIFLRH